jgi:hypothetical protein
MADRRSKEVEAAEQWALAGGKNAGELGVPWNFEMNPPSRLTERKQEVAPPKEQTPEQKAQFEALMKKRGGK